MEMEMGMITIDDFGKPICNSSNVGLQKYRYLCSRKDNIKNK